MEESPEKDIKNLEPVAIFGFNGKPQNYKAQWSQKYKTYFSGKINCGIKVHPSQQQILFPFGNKITVIGVRTHKQEFLVGHDDIVTALDVSPS